MSGRRFSDHEKYYQSCLDWARPLAQQLQFGGNMRGMVVLDFLERHCFRGFPSDQVGRFITGDWLSRPGKPAIPTQGIAWIMCLSSDIPPLPKPQGPGALHLGCFTKKGQALILFDIDQWSSLELALCFLHEGNHAVQSLGLVLDTVPPLDLPGVHETNTWIFTFDLLKIIGGTFLSQAVEKEIAWLEQNAVIPTGEQDIVFLSSTIYWPELDHIFGPSSHPAVRTVRQQLVARLANIYFWAEKRGVRPEDVCRTLIKYFYQEA